MLRGGVGWGGVSGVTSWSNADQEKLRADDCLDSSQVLTLSGRIVIQKLGTGFTGMLVLQLLLTWNLRTQASLLPKMTHIVLSLLTVSPQSPDLRLPYQQVFVLDNAMEPQSWQLPKMDTISTCKFRPSFFLGGDVVQHMPLGLWICGQVYSCLCFPMFFAAYRNVNSACIPGVVSVPNRRIPKRPVEPRAVILGQRQAPTQPIR